MATRQRPCDLGAQDARRLREALGRELHDARLALGISQASVAVAAGLSRAQVGRFERAEIVDPGLAQMCRAARVLGLQASLKLYPAGSPVRDRAHLALIARFEARLGAPLRLRREVPLPIAGDPRAWDGVVSGSVTQTAAEFESHMTDLQAISRRIGLKLRDDPRVGAVILVVNRTGHNRIVIREHREALRDLFPLDGGQILRDLGAGRCPAAGGILML